MRKIDSEGRKEMVEAMERPTRRSGSHAILIGASLAPVVLRGSVVVETGDPSNCEVHRFVVNEVTAYVDIRSAHWRQHVATLPPSYISISPSWVRPPHDDTSKAANSH